MTSPGTLQNRWSSLIKRAMPIWLAATLWAYGQDLELDVHVLPPAQLGDPAAFNIRVRNTGEEVAKGAIAQITLGKGVEFMSFTPDKEAFDTQTGRWTLPDLAKAQAKVLTIMATYKAREDAVVSAEIVQCLSPDQDSTPGNGIDTNGNGKIVGDKGDEDDGDAAEIRIPF